MNLKRNIQSLKVDVAKNQEYLFDIVRMINHNGTNRNNDENICLDRSNLKIPIKNLEELKALESNNEQKQILVSFKN